MARCALETYEVLCVSVLMQLCLALPMVYYFHRATVLGIVANSLAVPLTGILMPAAVLAVCAQLRVVASRKTVGSICHVGSAWNHRHGA